MDTSLSLVEKLLACANLLEVTAADAPVPAKPAAPAAPAKQAAPAPAAPAKQAAPAPEQKKPEPPAPPAPKEAAPPEEPQNPDEDKSEEKDPAGKEQTPEQKKVFVAYKGDLPKAEALVLKKGLGYFCSTCAFFRPGQGTDGQCSKFGFDAKTYGLCNAYDIGDENKWSSPRGKKPTAGPTEPIK